MKTCTCIFTSNKGSGSFARDELQRRFQTADWTPLSTASDDVFIGRVPVQQTDLLTSLAADEPVFVRHVQPVDAVLDRRDPNLALAVADAIAAPGRVKSHETVALHMRKTDAVEWPLPFREFRQSVANRIVERLDVFISPNRTDWIVSVFLGEQQAYVGVAKAEHHLSDWPGGAIRFRKQPGHISRAEFKLLEAEHRFKLRFDQARRALDIGAAPGGWTSLLLERGLEVTAVDPGQLHSSLLQHPRLTYLRNNAQQVRLPAEHFDWIVSDMSWDPLRSATIIKELLPSLRSGGRLLLTVKLMHGKPFKTMQAVTDIFAPDARLIRAKQLFHNRHELTMLFQS